MILCFYGRGSSAQGQVLILEDNLSPQRLLNIFFLHKCVRWAKGEKISHCFFRVSQSCPWKKCKMYVKLLMHVKFSKDTCLTVRNRIHKFSRVF